MPYSNIKHGTSYYREIQFRTLYVCWSCIAFAKCKFLMQMRPSASVLITIPVLQFLRWFPFFLQKQYAKLDTDHPSIYLPNSSPHVHSFLSFARPNRLRKEGMSFHKSTRREWMDLVSSSVDVTATPLCVPPNK